MKFQLSKPKPSELLSFLQKKKNQPYNYKAIYGTQSPPVKGFDNDHNFIVLGSGEAVWQSAKQALQNWAQFPKPWTDIEPKAPLQQGEVVAVLFRIFGIWFINSARIVYTIDESKRYGFAYGTLPGHVEKGEECFWIERNEQGEVSYHIRAFSQPAYWLVWLGYPAARYFQRQFVKQSLAHLKKLTHEYKSA
jgi:uncharacterized protein (UPF0548 family)